MSIDAIFHQAQTLPSIPKLVQELIDCFDSPHADGDVIAQKLAMDQVLTAKVLRLANSSFYGGHRKVSSVADAVVLLGLDALRTLVLASAVTSAFTPPKGMDLAVFWRRSFATAGLAKWLVQRGKLKGINAETAFTAGMMSEIGNLLLRTQLPDQMAELDAALADGEDTDALELELFGCTCADVGAELARRWRLPEVLCQAIAEQQAPLNNPQPNPYALLVYLAQELDTLLNQDLDSQEIEEAWQGPELHQAGLNPETLLSHLDEAKQIDSGLEELL